MSDNPVYLRAFVGRSFLDSDKDVWRDLRDMLDGLHPIGLSYEDAKEAQARPISAKVRELINRNDVYVGVLTRRYRVHASEPALVDRLIAVFTDAPMKKAWTASEWVVEEIGYAIGKDKPVVLLIEEGIQFPTTDLDGDTQWIRFQRGSLEKVQTELTQMLAGLIRDRVTSAAPVASATVEVKSVEEPQPEAAPSKPRFDIQIEALGAAVSSENSSEVERIHAEILAAEPRDDEDRKLVNAYLLSERARHGDREAFMSLKKLFADEPANVSYLASLCNTYSRFKQYDQVVATVRRAMTSMGPARQSNLALRLGVALRHLGQPQEAIDILTTRLGLEPDEENQLPLMRATASVAQDLKDSDLEAAYLEGLLKRNPADNHSRFRLAQLYSNSERSDLAAYHYRLLAGLVDWPNAANNLAVEYGELKLGGNEIREFEQIADQHPLAKANLASLYADARFFARADQLAREALVEGVGDELAEARARYAQMEVAKRREEEKKVLEALSDNTRQEREFMASYAEAYQRPLINDFAAKLKSPQGDIDVICTRGQLQGTGSVVRAVGTSGLYAVALGLRAAGSAELPRTETYALALKGTCHGAAAVYELTVSRLDSGATVLTSSPRIIKGLLVFEGNGPQLRALQREDTKRSITRWSL